MKITKEEINHVAHLARLEMPAEAVGKFADQIGQILEYVDTLNAIDTTGIAATSHATDLTNAFREDTVHAHIKPEDALANAPEKENGNFIVPRVIE